MSFLSRENKTESVLMQKPDGASSITEVNMLIYGLEIVTKIGKHFPVLFISMAGLNVAMATNAFLANSFAYGVMNSLFAINGLVFVTQMYYQNKANFWHFKEKQASQESLEIMEMR